MLSFVFQGLNLPTVSISHFKICFFLFTLSREVLSNIILLFTFLSFGDFIFISWRSRSWESEYSIMHSKYSIPNKCEKVVINWMIEHASNSSFRSNHIDTFRCHNIWDWSLLKLLVCDKAGCTCWSTALY